MFKPVCLADFEEHFLKSLDRNARDYFSSGANQELTLKDNVEAFNRYRLRPRMLRDVSNVNMKTTIMGNEIDFPIGIAPTGVQKMAHPEGEVATARAASSMNTCMILSTWSTTSIEEVAQANGSGLRWFQLYVFKDKSVTVDLVQRAEMAGYKAIVITVDTSRVGKKLADDRNRFNLLSHLHRVNATTDTLDNTQSSQEAQESFVYKSTRTMLDPKLTWDTITWMKSFTKLPVIVKGILTGEDAKLAVQHGVDGIIVSNHGGRQLDGVLAAIDVLGEVVEAVEGRVEVYLDGGVRQGTDVLKALALGAKAVFIGRPVLWGLAYQGQTGVEEVLRIIKEEFKLAMALSGVYILLTIAKSTSAPQVLHTCDTYIRCAKVTDIQLSLLAFEKRYSSKL
ncbi:2-Hydroxyacid oxidase 1-like isoform X2 [Dysidea avara]|uniref:2-Hydroxyacid oxidase 1-like isoform X2 n=1 Tax=Dysidea avara TaxID=196820 RepID=UPI00332D66FB